MDWGHVETEVLRWFLQVADGVTVTEVADLHLVSQPAVSRALAKLDEQVGTPLLAKSGRVLRLTEAGQIFRTHIEQSIHHLDDGIGAVAELLDPSTGTVSVAFETMLGTWLVPGIIAGFKRQYPRVRFRLTQTHEAHSWGTLLNGRIDMAFTSQPPPTTELVREELLELPLGLAVPPNHRFATRESVDLAEAADEPFIMVPNDWQMRAVTMQLCLNSGFSPHVAFEGEDVPVMRGFVAAGLGVAVVPLAQAEIQSRRTTERLIRLTNPEARLDIGLVWSSRRRMLPSAMVFRDHVLESRGLAQQPVGSGPH